MGRSGHERRPAGWRLHRLAHHPPPRKTAWSPTCATFAPQDIPIYGYVYDVRTARFREVAKATEVGRATHGRGGLEGAGVSDKFTVWVLRHI